MGEDATWWLSHAHDFAQVIGDAGKLPCGTKMAGERSETGWKSVWPNNGLAWGDGSGADAQVVGLVGVIHL